MRPPTTVPEAQQQRHRPDNPARHAFSELIDAKAAANLLGVPHTWLLAQARARKIPHHRLGHYVRFDPAELAEWLHETRIEPHTSTQTASRRS